VPITLIASRLATDSTKSNIPIAPCGIPYANSNIPIAPCGIPYTKSNIPIAPRGIPYASISIPVGFLFRADQRR